jgi:membrane protein implicated in regulation of membrane protease activity
MEAAIWGGLVVVFVVAEVATAGALFSAPFAIGAAGGGAVALGGGPVWLQACVFLIVSALTLAGLRPLARRLDQGSPRLEVGAGRWVGRQGVVVEAIPSGPGQTGMIRLDREVWRAESSLDIPIAVGSTVLVQRVDGVRLVVLPVTEVDS